MLGGDFVAEAFPHLCDTEGRLLPDAVHDVFKLDKHRLGGFGS